MDVKHTEFETELGIAILVLSFCIGYFILNSKLRRKKNILDDNLN
jgi:general stress protein CsbA